MLVRQNLLLKIIAEQHPVLPFLMLLNGAAPLLANAYTLPVQAAGFMLLGLAFLSVLTKGQGLKLSPPAGQALEAGGLFLLWVGVGLFWSADVGATWLEVLRLAAYLSVFALIVATFGNTEKEKLITTIILTGGLVAAYGLLQYLFLAAGRIQSTFVNPNPLGIFLAMIILIALGRYWQTGSRYLPPVLVLLGTALVFSYSRGSILAFAGGLAAVLFLEDKGVLGRRLVSLAGLALAVAAAAKLVTLLAPYCQEAAPAASIMASLLRPESFVTSSVEGRLTFWQTAGRIFLNRPLTGFGAGSFHDVYFAFADVGRWYSRYAHNHYLQVLAETGLPGLVLFGVTLFLLVWPQKWLRLRPWPAGEAALGGAIIAFLLHIGVDFTWDMPAVTLLFWSLLGLSLVGRAGRSRQGCYDPEVLPVPEERAGAPRWGYKTWFWVFLPAFLILGGLQVEGAYVLERRAAAAAQAGDSEAVLKWARWRVIIVPWDSSCWSQRAAALARKGHITAAINAAEKAVKLTPYSFAYAGDLGRLYRQAGRRAEAGEMFKRAVSLGGYVPSVYLDYGNFLAEEGQMAAAVEIWEEGVHRAALARLNVPDVLARQRLDTVEYRLRLNLARYYEDQGDYNLAAGELRAILILFPEDRVARQALAAYAADGHIQGPQLK